MTGRYDSLTTLFVGAVLAAWRTCISTKRTQVEKENFMKILATIARYLLALILIVFGLNGFLHFIPQPPPPSELAQQYFTVMFTSHYLMFVFGLQLIAGVLFLYRRTVPLALTIAGPLIVNILLFHALLDPGGIVPGLVVAALWFVIYWQFRAAFFGIFFTETQSDRSR
jgi:putative oxidoreductase